MTQIAILSADDGLIEALKTTGLHATRIDASTLATYGTGAPVPQVVVADLRGRDHFPASLTQFRRQQPGVGVVLVLSTLDPKIMLEGMRAGVSECLAEPVTAKALDEAIRRLLTTATPEPAGQVFAFVGAKGGVGTTTLAVNTATAVSKAQKGSQVLLVDLHAGHGDDAVFMGVEPRFSVLDALDNIHKVDESFFAGIVEKAEGGVHLLASPARPRPGAVDPKRVRALLDSAAKMYRTTVIDVPRSDIAVLDSLDSVTALVVVTSQEIASLRNAARMADMLRQRYGPSRVKVVINRFEKTAAIAHADVERVVGTEVKHLIPSDYRVAVDALNAGRPIVLDSESRLAAALVAFARELTGVKKERAAKPAGVLGRLAWRRA